MIIVCTKKTKIVTNGTVHRKLDSTYHPVLPKKNKVDGRVISSRSNIAFKK